MNYRHIKIINRILIIFLVTMTVPTFGAILENGWSVVACKPESSAGGSTLAVKDITQFGTLWNTASNRGNTIDHSGSMPTGAEWKPSDFGGNPVFSTTIDPRDGTIYTVTTSLYNIASAAVIPATIYKIDNVTGSMPTVLATLPGNAGGGFLDIDINHDQLFVIDMDSGTIHRVSLAGTLLSSYDPLAIDDGLTRFPALGERLLGVAYHPSENRVYYSVWADDFINNGNPNVVRSIGLNASGEFNPASDDVLEMSLTTNQPVADIEFNRAYTSVLLAETGFNSSIPRTQPHQAAVTEWIGGTGNWSQVGTNAYYRIGSGSSARNARGGAAWAYSTVNAGMGFTGLDDFILVTADALRVSSPAIYGYQFIPRNTPPRDLANSIVADLDNNTAGQDKSIYGDVDIYLVPDTTNACPDPSNPGQTIPAIMTAIPAGFPDGFDPGANNPELNVRSAEVQVFIDDYATTSGNVNPTPSRQNRPFDVMSNDQAFGHTFTGLPANIIDADLELGLKNWGSNDGLSLKLDQSNAFAWNHQISNLPEAASVSQAIFNLDLDNLPNPNQGGGITNIISELALDQTLDVFIQDDTAVDYMILNVTSCPVVPDDVDIVIEKRIEGVPSPLMPGDTFFYVIKVTNNSATTATNIVVDESLPSGVTFNAFLNPLAHSADYNASNGKLTIPSLPANGMVTLNVSVTVGDNTCGNISNTASLVSLDQIDVNSDNNQSTVDIISECELPKVDIAIEKQRLRTTSPPAPGSQVDYLVTVTNLGPGDATNIDVNDLLPTGFVNSSVLGDVIPLGSATYDPDTGILNIPSLLSQDAVTLSITATLDELACGDIINTASLVSVDQTDTDDSNNQAMEGFQLSPCISCVDPVNSRVATAAGTAAIQICHMCPDPRNANATVLPTTHNVILDGTIDNFVGVEPTTPGPNLSNFPNPNPNRQFDDLGTNRVFRHTLSNLPSNIVTASLDILLRPQGSSLQFNDSVNLETIAGGTQFAWGHQINNLGIPFTTNVDALIRLDLKNLPPNGSFSTNILTEINSDHALDVLIEDDTAVDYVALTVQTCPATLTKFPDELATLRAGTGHLSGSWFDTSLDGQGVSLEVLDNDSAVLTWYNYDQLGNQRWMIGVGSVAGTTVTVDDMQTTSGGMFGPGFDPSTVIRESWGRVSIDFSSCDNGTLQYESTSGTEIGIQQLTRLTHLSGLKCELPNNNNGQTLPSEEDKYSGTWFDPSHNGEGAVVQMLENNQALVYWYTYDQFGNQVWILGVGSVNGDTITVDELITASGGIFGPDFDPDTVVREPWGTITITFSSCTESTLQYQSILPGFGSGQQDLIRLSSAKGLGCQ